MNRLFEIPTGDTLAFLEPLLPSPARILEVGCGEGHVARALRASGHEVLALDRNPDCVRTASEQGVTAQVAEWPEVDCEPVDVVLFTRLLHHLHDLEAALGRAIELLRSGGRVIAEDYGVTEMDPRGAAWLYSVIEPLHAGGRLVTGDTGFAAQLLAHSGDAHAALDQHDLHSAPAMQAALGRLFGEVAMTTSPYFYRYALPLLPDDEYGAGVLRELLSTELRLLAEGAFEPLGRRFVAARALG